MGRILKVSHRHVCNCSLTNSTSYTMCQQVSHVSPYVSISYGSLLTGGEGEKGRSKEELSPDRHIVIFYSTAHYTSTQSMVISKAYLLQSKNRY